MNKIIFVVAALLLINTQVQSQNNQAANWKNTLIPKPVSIVKGQGYYKFPQDIVIITPANE